MSTKNHSGELVTADVVPLDQIVGAVELPNGRALTNSRAPSSPHHFTQSRPNRPTRRRARRGPRVWASWRGCSRCAVCRAPTPATRLQYVRRNGPYTLGMSAGINNRLPYGTRPRLLLAWVCTEAVRTQIARTHPRATRWLRVHAESGHLQHHGGDSASPDFGIRCGGCLAAHVELIYQDEHGERSIA